MKLRVPRTLIALATPAWLMTGCFTVVEKPNREVVVVEPHKQGPPPWAPAHGWRRKHETYYYYPSHQVYYYPHLRRYYWFDGGHWRYGTQLPRHYVIHEHRKVVLDLDYEPHHHHHKIKEKYPHDYHEHHKRKADSRR